MNLPSSLFYKSSENNFFFMNPITKYYKNIGIKESKIITYIFDIQGGVCDCKVIQFTKMNIVPLVRALWKQGVFERPKLISNFLPAL